MALLADFITIIGDSSHLITHVERDFSFDTGGRAGGEQVSRQALITFDIKGLKTDVIVKVNGMIVGKLHGYPDTANFQNAWFSQTVGMFGSRLKSSGDNVLELEANPGDSFRVKNVYCFFHQHS